LFIMNIQIKQHLLFLLKLLAALFMLFFFQRICFVVYYWKEINEAEGGQLWQVPFRAFRLDLAIASFMMIIPFLLSLPVFFITSEKALKRMNLVILIFTCIIFLISILIHAGEIIVYQEWKTKLSTKVFIHFQTPDEIVRTASYSYTVGYFLFVLLQGVFMWLIYFKWMKKNKFTLISLPVIHKILHASVSTVILLPLFVIFGRGGVNPIPISLKDAYFSKDHIINDLTANSTWNFMHSWIIYVKFNLDKYFDIIPKEEAEAEVGKLLVHDDAAHVQVLKNKNCNLVFIVLEGWSAQLIEPLGGIKDITPNFNKACKEGILFKNIYATSWTSEIGNATIFSGYPAVPEIAISQEPDKIRKMASMANVLEEYESHFFFGGSLSYGNIGGYMMDAGFDKTTDENQMTHLNPKGKLGIHDEAAFSFFYDEVMKLSPPFMYCLFTQSTHAPFDFPGNENNEISDENLAFKASMTYADKQLGEFLDKFRKSKFYDNTMIVMISDHGRVNEVNGDPFSQKMYHIPALFWGGALEDSLKGMEIDRIGSQADFAKTILLQMGKDVSGFKWTKDMLNPTYPEFALHTCFNGYGWLDTTGHFAYDLTQDIIYENTFSSEEEFEKALHTARCYITCIYRSYREL
ncbi:MAG: LTA synthase family protein, partial [Bacteroidota bacterium]